MLRVIFVSSMVLINYNFNITMKTGEEVSDGELHYKVSVEFMLNIWKLCPIINSLNLKKIATKKLCESE